MWKALRTIWLDRTLLSVILLLIAVDILDILFLHPIVPELDILEHFLFGFALSELATRTANAIGLVELLTRKPKRKDSWSVDLLVRLLGFFLIGGLLWEASESFVFPLFGYTPNYFFRYPITLENIDGMIDVVVGTVACLVAWYLSKSRHSDNHL